MQSNLGNRGNEKTNVIKSIWARTRILLASQKHNRMNEQGVWQRGRTSPGWQKGLSWLCVSSMAAPLGVPELLGTVFQAPKPDVGTVYPFLSPAFTQVPPQGRGPLLILCSPPLPGNQHPGLHKGKGERTKTFSYELHAHIETMSCLLRHLQKEKEKGDVMDFSFTLHHVL